MKIQLEQKLDNHSYQLCCVACQHSFSSMRLRTLLCHDSGSIVGDVCTECLKQGTRQIQRQFRVRSIELFQQHLIENISLSSYQQALELSELATQPLAIPRFYARWWKQLSIFATEPQASEMARQEPIDFLQQKYKP